MPDEYVVSFRKYRPKKFKQVVGQQAVVTTLQNAIRFQRLSQAYLFAGPHGVGKTTLARIFSMALNCKNLDKDTLEPCGTCSNCQEIAIGKSLDVIEIDGASNRGIEEIRKINEAVGYTPSSSQYKIYIIDEVHMLTKEAFNALLKTLEEPPKQTKFFFATTEAHKILPTILSRCQRFDLKQMDEKSILYKLKKIIEDQNRAITEEALQKIEQLAQGSMRNAESLLDQVLCFSNDSITLEIVTQALGLIETSFFDRLDRAIVEENLSEAFLIIEDLLQSGKDLQVFFEELLEHFRIKLKKSLQQGAKDRNQYLFILDQLMQTSRWILKSPMKRSLIEILLLQLIRSKNHVSLDSLVRRLYELEEKSPFAQVQNENPIPAQISPPTEKKLPKPLLESEEETNKPFIKREKKIFPSSARHETLMRFAAVELEGIIQK